MITALAATWSLFIGLVSSWPHGLQSTLLGVRAGLEGFDETVTGVIMAGYYAGFLIGSLVTLMVKRVGHIRVFAAVASVASVAVLAHSVLIEPISWTAMRIATGFCVATLYIVAESWLNDRATNRPGPGAGDPDRGYAGHGRRAISADPLRPQRLRSFHSGVRAAVDLTGPDVAVGQPGSFDAPQPVSLRVLYISSPLAVVGAALLGVAQGALLGMSAVCATCRPDADISIFVSAFMIGGVLLQFPVGRLSDRFDRLVATVVTLIAAGVPASLDGSGIWTAGCCSGWPRCSVDLPVDVRVGAQPRQRPSGARADGGRLLDALSGLCRRRHSALRWPVWPWI